MSDIDIFFYCFNHSQFLNQALDSIKYQTNININKLIIIDDGSEDKSSIILLNWAEKNKNWIDNNVQYFDLRIRKSVENQGQTSTLLEGLSENTAKYLAILEGDDYWISDCHLSELIKVLEDANWISAAFSSWISMTPWNEIKEVRSPRNISDISEHIYDSKKLLKFNAPGTLSACVYRGELVREILPLAKQCKLISDFGLNLFMTQFGPLYFSSRISLNYRYIEKSAWRSINFKQQEKIIQKILADYAALVIPEVGALIREHLSKLETKNEVTQVIRYSILHPRTAFLIFLRKMNQLRKVAR